MNEIPGKATIRRVSSATLDNAGLLFKEFPRLRVLMVPKQERSLGVQAVKELNANSKRIADSPVKHLVRIRTKPYGQATPIFITGHSIARWEGASQSSGTSPSRAKRRKKRAGRCRGAPSSGGGPCCSPRATPAPRSRDRR